MGEQRGSRERPAKRTGLSSTAATRPSEGPMASATGGRPSRWGRSLEDSRRFGSGAGTPSGPPQIAQASCGRQPGSSTAVTAAPRAQRPRESRSAGADVVARNEVKSGLDGDGAGVKGSAISCATLRAQAAARGVALYRTGASFTTRREEAGRVSALLARDVPLESA